MCLLCDSLAPSITHMFYGSYNVLHTSLLPYLSVLCGGYVMYSRRLFHEPIDMYYLKGIKQVYCSQHLVTLTVLDICLPVGRQTNKHTSLHTTTVIWY